MLTPNADLSSNAYKEQQKKKTKKEDNGWVCDAAATIGYNCTGTYDTLLGFSSKLQVRSSTLILTR
eukprot:scaffold5310_cov54-Attheya_sp.AAC.3